MADGDLIHDWFELTYANYLVLPRSMLQSMPEEWQEKMVTLIKEMERSFPHLECPIYDVRARDHNTGRYIPDPIPHYNRGRTKLPLYTDDDWETVDEG